jgi:glycoprotein endo-alpha-1,2-mannosidase
MREVKQIVTLTIASVVIGAFAMFTSCSSGDDPVVKTEKKKVEKTNPMVIYMHYMPWFQSKEISGYWGSHWRMNTANPETVDDDGKRQIASHYYPLIGPYDSKDPDVIEYHLLLMKYAGVDGLLIDWYSSHNINDYRAILDAVNSMVSFTDDVGMDYALVYEDYTAGAIEDQTSKTSMEAAKADLAYMQKEYFSQDQYITFDDKPLLLTFGPRFFKQGSQWTEIFSGLKEKPKFLPLWNHSSLTGDTYNGEFSWIDFNSDLSQLNNFYNRASLEIMIGSAYPGFHDYYVEGGWGTSYGYVPFNDGQTLSNTLAKAKEKNVKHLQLVTWNDFGEGTVIEPTLENEFQSLKLIQQFAGVSYGEEELRMIHEYFIKKKKYKGDDAAIEKLSRVFLLLADLDVEKARALLTELD